MSTGEVSTPGPTRKLKLIHMKNWESNNAYIARSSWFDPQLLICDHHSPVGKLVGRYYDSQGNPTKHLKGVEAKASRGAQLMEKQKIEEAKQTNCNSRWSQDEGGEVYKLLLSYINSV